MENYSLIFFAFLDREVISLKFFFTLPFNYFVSSKYDEKHLVKLLVKQESIYHFKHFLFLFIVGTFSDDMPKLYLEKNID